MGEFTTMKLLVGLSMQVRMVLLLQLKETMSKQTASGTARIRDSTQMDTISMTVSKGMPTPCTRLQEATARYLRGKRIHRYQSALPDFIYSDGTHVYLNLKYVNMPERIHITLISMSILFVRPHFSHLCFALALFSVMDSSLNSSDKETLCLPASQTPQTAQSADDQQNGKNS